MSKDNLNLFGDKESVEEPEKPKQPVTAKGWRESGVSLFTLPSGVVIRIRSLNRETFKLCMPWLASNKKEGEERSIDEVSLQLQEIIVPRHVIEPKVVMSQEEEDNTPNSIFIENIPLIDRFTIATYIIRQDEYLYDKAETESRKKALKTFQPT